MNKCGKTILKWKEPKTFQRFKDKQLTLVKRFLLKHIPSFLSGFIIFFIVSLIESESIPNSFTDLMFLSIVSSIMGFLFVIIYGLLGLTSPRISLKENCIIRQHVEDVKQFKYSALQGYDISNFIYENQHIRLFILEHYKKKEIILKLIVKHQQ